MAGKVTIRAQRDVDRVEKTTGGGAQYFNTEDTYLKLAVSRGGAKTWYFQYWPNGKLRRKRFADASAMTLEDAQKRARELQVKVDKGLDPFVEEEDPAGDRLTVSELCDLYVRDYTQGGKFGQRQKKQITEDKNQSRIKHLKEHWGDLPAEEIKAEHCGTLHQILSEESGLTGANRVLQLWRSIWNTCQKDPLNHLDPNLPNPTRSIRWNEETPRTRHLSRAEWKKLREGLEEYTEYPTIRWIVLLQFITACREADVVRFAWKNVDRRERVVRVKGKSDDTYTKVLGREGLAVLDEIHGHQEAEEIRSPWVFPHHGDPEQHMEYPYSAWRSAIQEIGFWHPDDPQRHLIPHDLRRTRGCWMLSDGYSIEEVSAFLDHANTAVTERHYAFMDEATKREAAEEHTASLDLGV